MIENIKNKYYTYETNDFLPIYVEGKLANRNQFHIYKLKKFAIAADHAWMRFVEKAYAI